MKKGLAISAREENGNAHVEAALVQGGLKTGFRVNALINHTFTEADIDPKRLLEHMNVVILEAISPIHHNQREIPVVVGTSGGMVQKLLPQHTYNALQRRSNFPPDVYLAEAWTGLVQLKSASSKVCIHPGVWEDEYDLVGGKDRKELVLPSEVQSLIVQIRDCVDTLHKKSSLRFLQERAFLDGKECAEKDFISGQAGVRFRLLDDPGLSASDAVRHTYLNEHPSLKKEFVRGMGSFFGWQPLLIRSKNSPIIPPYYSSIKTRKDPKALKFVNVVMTYLADQCSREGEGIPYGHIQETV